MTINYQQPYQNGFNYQQMNQPFYGQTPPGMNPYGYPPYQSYPLPQQDYNSYNNYYQEQSYVENILRLNRGKIATIYMSFEGSQWGSKIFRGEIVGAGRDHIILKDEKNKASYLLLTIYLSYVTFDETIEYDLA